MNPTMNHPQTNGVAGTNHHQDHFQVSNHVLPIHQQPQTRDQWPQVLPHNQPQQFHTTPWQQSPQGSVPQMQPQGFPVPQQYTQNQTTVGFDFASLVPQQIMQDFLRLSTPVGSSPNDDAILAQALYESKQTGRTYRQALEALHGVNNHASHMWKDYYLDHHDRFDVLVSRLAEQPKTVKKPFVTSKSPPRVKEEGTPQQVARKRHISPPPPPPSPSPPPQPTKKRGRSSGPAQPSRRKRTTPQKQSVTTSSILNRPPKRPRATMNSLSAPLPTNENLRLMPPQVHIPLPDPPSRSPSPPAVIQAGTNGNRYTKEDREYFIKFLVWRLKQDPSLTKKELCEMLHEKAPHHSANSWASHWHQRHDIADKILATYHKVCEEDPGDDEEQDDEEEEEVEAEMQNDEDDEDDAQSETMSATETSRRQRRLAHSEGPFSDFGDHDVDTEEDEADMGEPGSAFTRGDWCTLARFIARNHWDEMAPKERWQSFTETHGAKRNAKSWAEFYRRNESAILKLSRRYSPGASTKRTSRRGSRGEALHGHGSDEDGEYETDNGDS